MVRVARFLVVIVSLIALPAFAADQVRTTDGRLITLDEGVVYLWSMHEPSSVEALEAAARTGELVIAVNTDPVYERSRIRPFLRARGVEVPIVQDVDGAIVLQQQALLAHEASTDAEPRVREKVARKQQRRDDEGQWECGLRDPTPETYAQPASPSAGRAVVVRPR